MYGAVAQYPAFQRAVVLESSFSARKKLVRELRAAHLFMHILEAESFRDGVRILAQRTADACLVGTSVAKDKALEFIRLGKQVSEGHSCAFIAIIPPSLREEDSLHLRALNEAGVHSIIDATCSRRELSREVINAVHRGYLDAEAGLERARLSGGLLLLARALNETAGLLARKHFALPCEQVTLDEQQMVTEALLAAFGHCAGELELRNFAAHIAFWFTARSRSDPATALDELRKRLLREAEEK